MSEYDLIRNDYKPYLNPFVNNLTVSGSMGFNGPAGTSGNVIIGKSAGSSITTGTDDVAIGFNALHADTTGVSNIAIGSNALSSNTTGGSNVAVGVNALSANSTASKNSGLGWSVLNLNATGTQNVAVGYNVCSAQTGANDNTGVGYNVLSTNVGSANTAVGSGALVANSTGTNNVAVGQGAGPAITSGASNIVIGQGAGAVLTTGSGNIMIGASAQNATEANVIRLGAVSATRTFITGSYPILNKPAPFTMSAAGAAPLAADMIKGVYNANAAFTTDTGTNIDGAFTAAGGALQVGDIIPFYVQNTNAAAITITAGAGVSFIANAPTGIGIQAQRCLFFQKTAANTFVMW